MCQQSLKDVIMLVDLGAVCEETHGQLAPFFHGL